MGGRLPHAAAADRAACRCPTRGRRRGRSPRRPALDPEVRARAARLARRASSRARPHLIVKDPRLSWFLPLWRRVRRGARRRAALRDDAAPPGRGDRLQAALVRRVAGRRRARRGLGAADAVHRARDARLAARVRALRGPARRLDARPSRGSARRSTSPSCATRRRRRCATSHGFVDRGLCRSRADWGDLKLPAPLRAQADEVWELVSALAGDGGARHADARRRRRAARAARRAARRLRRPLRARPRRSRSRRSPPRGRAPVAPAARLPAPALRARPARAAPLPPQRAAALARADGPRARPGRVTYGPAGGVVSHVRAGAAAPTGMQRRVRLNGLRATRLNSRVVLP